MCDNKPVCLQRKLEERGKKLVLWSHVRFEGPRSQPPKTPPPIQQAQLLTHLVLGKPLSLSHRIISLDFVGDLDVQITLVLVVWLVVQYALDLLALLHGQNFAEVEDGLLPVGVFCVWAGGEADGFVAGGEVDIEPSDEGVHKIVTANIKGVWYAEGEVGRCASIEVKGDNCGGVGNYGFDFDCVDERFSEGGDFERGVVESVNVIPD